MGRKFYVVEGMYPWSSLTIDGVPIHATDSDIVGYLPVYADREIAERDAKGRFAVREMETDEAERR